LGLPLAVQVGGFAIAKPLLLWVNDGLMAIFFILVGLEVKRAVVEGELSSLSNAALPVTAAIGGMAGPVLVYVACNWDDTEALRGWAIPMATNIAFALGVLALLGSRAPPSLKIFLLALAIIDDLSAIIIIAGVIVGVAMPLNAADGSSPARDLEHALHPWIAFGVFDFANAGLSLTDIRLSDLLHPIKLGIGLGLFIGKQLGVIVSIWIATRAGFATLPEGTDWRHRWSRAIDRHRLHNESVYGHARISGRGL